MALVLRYGVINLKSGFSKNHHQRRSVIMDEQKRREIEIVKKEDNNMDTDFISRRRVAIIGFNAVILHVCPAHGALPLIGYSGSTGPDKWGSMSPSYGSCSFGNAQSPVQIMVSDLVFDGNLDPLNVEYNDASATLINNGFNCEVHFVNDVGGAIIDGKKYKLKQMHWHSPSEHTIEGIRYAAELHMVHVSVDGSVSVVAILYKNGTLDPLLYQVKDEFNQLSKQAFAGHDRPSVAIRLVRIKDIITESNKRGYFRYAGSLTTPPCTEKVIWNILKEVREISLEQVAALKAPLDELCKNNSRPTQPLNKRRIRLSAAVVTSLT